MPAPGSFGSEAVSGMEEPLDRALRRKPPLAAFWEGSRRPSDGPFQDESTPPRSTGAASSLATAANSSRAPGGSSVQRLIQQYSASTSSPNAAGTGTSDTPKPLRRGRVSAAAAAADPSVAGHDMPISDSTTPGPPLRPMWGPKEEKEPPTGMMAMAIDARSGTETAKLDAPDNFRPAATSTSATSPTQHKSGMMDPLAVVPIDSPGRDNRSAPAATSDRSKSSSPANTSGPSSGPGTDQELSAGASGSDSPYRTPTSSQMLPSASTNSVASSAGQASIRGGGFEPVIPRRSLSYDPDNDPAKTVSMRPRSSTRTFLTADEESWEARRHLNRGDFSDENAYLAFRDAEKSRRMKKTLKEQLKRRSKRRSGSVQGLDSPLHPAHAAATAAVVDDSQRAIQHRASLSTHSSHSATTSVSSSQHRLPATRQVRPSAGREIWIDSGSSSSSRDMDHDVLLSGRSSPRSLSETFYDAELSSPTKIPPEASFLPRSSSRGSDGIRKSKQRSLSLAEESDQLDGPWLDLGSPTLHEPTSTSTLRQDAIRQDLSNDHQSKEDLNLSASSSIDNTATTEEFASTWPSSSADDLTTASSRTNSLPTSSLSSAPVAPAMTPSTSQLSLAPGMNNSLLRSSRTGATLPPPRPTPNAPLPPPPPGASLPGRTSSRLRGYTSTAQPGAVTIGPSDELLPRNRSFSVGQSALAAAPQRSQRDSSLGVFRDFDIGGLAAPSPGKQALHQPPNLGQMGRSLSSTPTSTSSELSSSQQSETLGPSGTIRGRPRGFTVGAVPASSGYSTYSSARTLGSSKSRPRSLLCHEIVPGLDLAERRLPTSVVASGSSARPFTDASSSIATMGEPYPRRRSEAPLNTLDPAARRSDSVSSFSSYGERGDSSSSRLTSGQGASACAVTTSMTPDGATDRRPSIGGRSRSGSSASLLQQVKAYPKSHASFVIAVVGHSQAGKSTVIKKGLRQFGLSKPHVLSEKVTSHSTACVVDQEQRTIEVLEIDASVLLNGPGKRFAWPKFLPRIDAVILCYDAAQIASFRGMSELLENFALSNLSTVMLACKSEVHPKEVDPYYASDMASVYNVGLAECTVESEEGKKRMRDCFSYLVKEVAKARTGRTRRATPSSAPQPSQTQNHNRQQESSLQSTQSSPYQPQQPLQVAGALWEGERVILDHEAGQDLEAPPRSGSISSSRARGDSGASSYVEPPNNSLAIDADARSFEAASSPSTQTEASMNVENWRNTPRKMSNATVSSNLSDAPSYTGSQEDDLALQESLTKARIGLQNARSAGGYVTIEELWDKLFHAAVSGNDERFRDMFMVFYRGFARPIDLLRQMVARFEALATVESNELVMNRFALIRLTNMLGEWVQSYPGDLSHPDTYAMLNSFYARLQQHPSTTHTASLIRAAVEAAAHAPDVDAVWSKAVEGAQEKPANAASSHTDDHAAMSSSSPASSELEPLKSSTPGPLISPSSSGVPTAQSLVSTPSAVTLDEDSSPDAPQLLASLGRGGSETSLLPTPVDPFRDGRNRSASDVTTSSTEGGRAFLSARTNGGTSVAGSSTIGTTTQASSAATSGVSATAPASPSASALSAEAALRPLDQKAALRAISNTLMEVDDEVIANEMTRLEWRLFTAIRPRDLLRHILVPRELRDGPVARSIAHFNYISAWVCSMILAQGKTKHRARMLEKFYNIASILRHDNNYGSLNSVLGGLSKTAVHRLKHTRELLKGKPVNKIYQSLVRLMSSERSNAAYRLALENSDGATVPYVGVHLQDILSISDGNPSKRSDGLVHWRKFSLMDEAVMAIVRCQQHDRPIKANPAVEKLIIDVPVMDDEALYERSLVVEPRTQPGQTIASSKIKDLKSFLSNASHAAANAA